MKKLIIAIVSIFIVICYLLSIAPSKVSADELAFRLYGTVRYRTSNQPVGPGKLVYIYDTPNHYIGWDTTDNGGNYNWGFYNSLYVYKLSCHFYPWGGDTIVDTTLTGDTRIDFYVDYLPGLPDGADQ